VVGSQHKNQNSNQIAGALGGDVSAGQSVQNVMSFGKGKAPVNTSNGCLNRLQSSLLSGCRKNTVTGNLRVMKQCNVSERVYRVVYVV
jgi:hypothetical protein